MELKILQTKKVDLKLLNQLKQIKKQLNDYTKDELKEQLKVVVDFLIEKINGGQQN